ncbi:FtsQ-type POTRA domain-containing protein [Paenarthrobacter sp. PH39-S1]|uniref:cell division protein FtsQ/DivIB n=1 Tax=Paenarthrobacter sp. PH39-S1 TaxID=3046204 RepID=UPI0024BB4DE6|nr:FtsQ-type POTRA domain-containing protein [Paenarthrobacter sp. PH39-S1]MDJ0356940.1 FtsQ-type POTRA domain-containing protein [Paenarthrobacter sp. PH39-S1]
MTGKRKPPVIRTDPAKPGPGFRTRSDVRSAAADDGPAPHSGKVTASKIGTAKNAVPDDAALDHHADSTLDDGGMERGTPAGVGREGGTVADGRPGDVGREGGALAAAGREVGAFIATASTAAPASTARAGSAKVSVLALHAAPGAPEPLTARLDSPGSDDVESGPSAVKGPSATVLAFPAPPRRRRRRNLWIAVVGIAVVVAAVLAIAMFSPLLALKTITVDGNKLATTGVIQAALAPLKDKPLPQIDQAQVEHLLAPLQQVRSVSVEARPPSSLLVHVLEREPVALLKTDQQYIMVDPDGIQLGGTADPAAVALPLIDGGTAVIGKETFKAMAGVLAALPQTVLAKLEHASAASPDAVELTLNDGKTIIWGNASEKELKAKVLEALLNAPAPTAAVGKPAPAAVQVYDVSTPRHPVTR